MNVHKISYEHLIKVLQYNPATGIFLWKTNSMSGQIAGSISGTGYRRIMIDKTEYAASHLAWLYFYKTHPHLWVDHINRKRDDNRIKNLRLATRSQNVQNTTARKDNLCGQKGVSWHKLAKKWVAQITVNKKHHYLGLFESINDASNEYKKASLKLHSHNPFNEA